MADVGAFPITGVGNMPNVTVAFPGEHWSDGKASQEITPGSMVVPINSGGKLYWEVAASGTVNPQAAIALRCVDIPDGRGDNMYGTSYGPNEIRNLPIAIGEYVHAYNSGAFHLTLVTPAVYVPSDLIGWDPAGVRPVGKAGTGAWKKVTNPAYALFAVSAPFRPYGPVTNEGLLTVRSLRGQF